MKANIQKTIEGGYLYRIYILHQYIMDFGTWYAKRKSQSDGETIIPENQSTEQRDADRASPGPSTSYTNDDQPSDHHNTPRFTRKRTKTTKIISKEVSNEATKDEGPQMIGIVAEATTSAGIKCFGALFGSIYWVNDLKIKQTGTKHLEDWNTIKQTDQTMTLHGEDAREHAIIVAKWPRTKLLEDVVNEALQMRQMLQRILGQIRTSHTYNWTEGLNEGDYMFANAGSENLAQHLWKQMNTDKERFSTLAFISEVHKQMQETGYIHDLRYEEVKVKFVGKRRGPGDIFRGVTDPVSVYCVVVSTYMSHSTLMAQHADSFEAESFFGTQNGKVMKDWMEQYGAYIRRTPSMLRHGHTHLWALLLFGHRGLNAIFSEVSLSLGDFSSHGHLIEAVLAGFCDPDGDTNSRLQAGKTLNALQKYFRELRNTIQPSNIENGSGRSAGTGEMSATPKDSVAFRSKRRGMAQPKARSTSTSTAGPSMSSPIIDPADMKARKATKLSKEVVADEGLMNAFSDAASPASEQSSDWESLTDLDYEADYNKRLEAEDETLEDCLTRLDNEEIFKSKSTKQGRKRGLNPAEVESEDNQGESSRKRRT
jgi:hypothetical protein